MYDDTKVERLEVIGIGENKNPKTNHLILGFLVVEPQGFEPWSREDDTVPSTCLVDFDCREMQGRQQPKHFRSHLS